MKHDMKKSQLYNDLMTVTEKLSRDMGFKRGVDADTFMVSAITFCKFDSQREDDAEEKAALVALVKDLIKDKSIDDFVKKYIKLIEDVNKDNSLAASLFYRLVYKAEQAASKKGKDTLTVDIMAETVIANPSDTLKACMSDETAAQDTGTSGEEASESDIVSSKRPAQTAPSGSSAPVAAPPSPSEEKETLAQLVNRVKDGQKYAMEVVFGQDHAISSFVEGYFQSEIASMTEQNVGKPKAVFLFAGPPGVGKTFLAEQTSKLLGLPFKRFNMSEFSTREASIQLIGSEGVFQNSEEGLLYKFVKSNPKCILLFDEIEKAHLNIIHLFLQILDAGVIRDIKTNKDISFKDIIIIFTTNAGRAVYNDMDIVNLSSVPRKQILSALATEKNPQTGEPFFPAAICSRFAAGNVVMFNRLNAHFLLKIAEKEIKTYADGFEKNTGIKVNIEPEVLYALLFSIGGKADARTIRGRSGYFFSQETYELFRLMSSDGKECDIDKLKTIDIKIEKQKNAKYAKLFSDTENPNVLVLASEEMAEKVRAKHGKANYYFVSNKEQARGVLFATDISLILCDVKCGVRSTDKDILNIEDIDSDGLEFLDYAVKNVGMPVYLIEEKEDNITAEELQSFLRKGATGCIYLEGGEGYDFSEAVCKNCRAAEQQAKLFDFAKANKVLKYDTKQTVNKSGSRATITLFNFKTELAPDADDADNLLKDVYKPDKKFADVIGAADAKAELQFFIKYLNNPAEFLRQGVRPPRGVLLYGPPGTGKTLLAKAMAGESGVTFIPTEGNAFLKKFVGDSPKAMHDIFAVARKYAPSILFIDEFDTFAKMRKDGSEAHTSEEVLTAFLSEMDGFKSQPDKPVFVLVATNYGVDGRGNSIDPAVVRRFDRKIYVDLPNKSERIQYIKLQVQRHKNVVLNDAQIDGIATRAIGMSLADIESIFELALRNAIRTDTFTVDEACFNDAFETFISGEVRTYGKNELISTARHEAGHTLLYWLNGTTPSYVTVVARGNYGGYMSIGDEEGKGKYTREELIDDIRVSLGGRAAELVYYGSDGLTTGASSDLNNATRVAESIVCRYGMDKWLVTVSPTDADPAFRAEVRELTNAILKEQLDKACEIIKEQKVAMDALVDALMERDHLNGDEIDEILKKTIKRKD